MGKSATDDFIVNTDGSCFLCLRRISTNDNGPAESQQLSTHSIQQLSRYLKMDIGKLFHDKGLLPQKLLAQVERSRLKVELCQGCASLTNSFSVLYQQREKVEMEMLVCLELIQGKLGTPAAPNSGLSKFPVRDRDLNGKSGLMMGKTDEVAEALRKEAAQKCFQKLGKTTPRVKIYKLNADKFLQPTIIDQIVSFNENCQPATPTLPETEAVEIKRERSDSVSELAQDLNIDEDQFFINDMNQPNDCTEDGTTNEEEPTVQMLVEYNVLNVQPSSSSTKLPPPIIIAPAPTNSTKQADCPQSIIDPETGKHKCKLCPKEFARKSYLKNHYDSIHLKLKYKCSLCGQEFQQNSSYHRHYQIVHLGIRRKCQKCNKVYKGTSDFNRHLRKSPCDGGWALKPSQT